jgi:hypothetical protein
VPLLWLPLVAFVPAHAPEAVQLVAFVELQLKVDAPPLVIDVGMAESETVGAGGGAGFVPGEAGAVVVDAPPSQPARIIPIPTIHEANATVRKYDDIILNTHHPLVS